MHAPLLYSGCPLDRAAELRDDETWLAARRRDLTTRVVPVWRGVPLVSSGEAPAMVSLTGEAALAALAAADEVVFLGRDADGAAWFAADLSALDAGQLAPFAAGGEFIALKRIAARLGADDGGVLAYALAMLHWHRGHRFCGRCGGPTRGGSGGHVRRCADPGCGEPAFPRTDPVVLMLVEASHGAGARCLLARQPRWPRGLVSTLAGFVEPGESLEAAVAREVREEVGLAVGRVRYVASQPWPFPCSLMLGFRAEVESGEGEGGGAIAFDRSELEDARWFGREAVLSLGNHGLKLPYAGTMARTLIEAWLAETAGDTAAGGSPPRLVEA